MNQIQFIIEIGYGTSALQLVQNRTLKDQFITKRYVNFMIKEKIYLGFVKTGIINLLLYLYLRFYQIYITPGAIIYLSLNYYYNQLYESVIFLMR